MHSWPGKKSKRKLSKTKNYGNHEFRNVSKATEAVTVQGNFGGLEFPFNSLVEGKGDAI